MRTSVAAPARLSARPAPICLRAATVTPVLEGGECESGARRRAQAAGPGFSKQQECCGWWVGLRQAPKGARPVSRRRRTGHGARRPQLGRPRRALTLHWSFRVSLQRLAGFRGACLLEEWGAPNSTVEVAARPQSISCTCREICEPPGHLASQETHIFSVRFAIE